MDLLTDATPQLIEGRIERLSPRQRHTLELLAQGYSNTAIADTMCITTRSVENYINVIFAALGLNDLEGRQPRVLAALSLHYQVAEHTPVGLLVRFCNASRRLRAARSTHATAQTEFDAASTELQDVSGYRISQVETTAN